MLPGYLWNSEPAQPTIVFLYAWTDKHYSIRPYFGTTFQPTDRYGNAPAIDASPDNSGVMLRNGTDPFVGTEGDNITLKITNLPTSGSYYINVYAWRWFYSSRLFYRWWWNGNDVSQGALQSFGICANGSVSSSHSGVMISSETPSIFGPA